MQTRKQFLKKTLSLAGGSVFIGNLENKLIAQQSNSGKFLFDLHCHPGRLFAKGSTGFGPEIDPNKTIREMNSAHMSGAFFTLVADSPLIKLGATGVQVTGSFERGEGWKEYKRQLLQMKDFLQVASIRVGIKVKDINNFKKQDSITAFLAVEGGDFLDGSTEHIEEAYLDGIRSIQLVHYVPNNIGDLQTSDPVHHGLSAFGKDAVRAMNKIGILIDVAHASFETVKEVVRLTDSPIMLSHSILEREADRPIAKRAISKEHAKAVAETGGLIGAWPSGFNKNFDEFVENTLSLVDVVGIDHVGIGTDMDGNFRPVLSNYKEYPSFSEALKTKGLSPTDVNKIMGENAKRLLTTVLKK